MYDRCMLRYRDVRKLGRLVWRSAPSGGEGRGARRRAVRQQRSVVWSALCQKATWGVNSAFNSPPRLLLLLLRSTASAPRLRWTHTSVVSDKQVLAVPLERANPDTEERRGLLVRRGRRWVHECSAGVADDLGLADGGIGRRRLWCWCGRG
jgi:hypothetical protein